MRAPNERDTNVMLDEDFGLPPNRRSETVYEPPMFDRNPWASLAIAVALGISVAAVTTLLAYPYAKPVLVALWKGLA